ncbi:MAG: nitrile hydratase subunit beta, partial [Hyphomicrobiales bacterium]
MNGAQDMGGLHGFGAVEPEPNEPVFHADWEKRAFALTLAMGTPGGWNIDMARFSRENRQPAEYLAMSYYQLWLAGLEALLKERDLVSDDEVVVGHSLHPPKSVTRILSPGDVAQVLYRGGPTERETNTKVHFKAGD